MRTLLNKIDNRILRRWSRRRFGCFFFFFSLSVFHWFELRKKEREEVVEEVVEDVVEEVVEEFVEEKKKDGTRKWILNFLMTVKNQPNCG